jgi:hypothetical protein
MKKFAKFSIFHNTCIKVCGNGNFWILVAAMKTNNKKPQLDEIEEMEETTRQIAVPELIKTGSIQVAWENAAKTILRYDFSEGWTWKDIFTIKSKGDQMMDGVQHPVGVLFVLPPKSALPHNAISNVRHLVKMTHPRAYASVMVSGDVYVKTIYNVLKQVYKPLTETFLHAETVERARELLAERHPGH